MRAHGYLMQLTDARALMHAIDALHAQGYRRLEAFTPYAVEGLMEKLGPLPKRIPPLMLGAGVVGGLGTLWMQYFAAAVDYPINAGGRPVASWPAFFPAAIEVTILFAVLAGFVTFLATCGFPAFYQPVFNVTWFEEASRDGFLLLLRADDPRWPDSDVAADIRQLVPMRYAEVEA